MTTCPECGQSQPGAQCDPCNRVATTRILRNEVSEPMPSDDRPLKVLYGNVESDKERRGERFVFLCPGCECGHMIWSSRKPGDPGPVWSFNGDMEKPTFNPSLLIRFADTKGDICCHSFIRDGNIQFLSDCTHKLAGQTVPLPRW